MSSRHEVPNDDAGVCATSGVLRAEGKPPFALTRSGTSRQLPLNPISTRAQGILLDLPRAQLGTTSAGDLERPSGTFPRIGRSS